MNTVKGKKRKDYAKVCKEIRCEYGINFVQFVELHAKLGHSCGSLAKILGVNYRSVKRWVEMRGLTLQRNPCFDLYENCDSTRDAVRKTGLANRKFIEFEGDIIYFAEREKELGLCNSGILKRLKMGWSLDKSLTTKNRRHGV